MKNLHNVYQLVASKLMVVSTWALSVIVAGCSHLPFVDKPLSSPDKATQVIVQLTDQHGLNYRINHQGHEVILPSVLGLELVGADFSKNLSWVGQSEITEVNDQYEMLVGKRRHIHYHANQQTITVKNLSGQLLHIDFQVANDGVAFRYRVNDSQITHKQFLKEHTEFSFNSRKTHAWMQPMAIAQTGWSNTNPSYEENYLMEIPVGTAAPTSAGWVFPALFKTDDIWVLVSEANLSRDWHASRLHSESPNGRYQISTPMAAEVFTGGGLLASTEGELSSPWRIVALGSLATIMESTLGTDLAAPAISVDKSTIKPGHASWSWAILKDDSITYDIQKKFIDYAAAMQWDYTLIDVNWDSTIGFEKLKQLADYAATKNIGLLVWINSSGTWNTTPYTPKSQLLSSTNRQQYFKNLQDIGIKGVKIDFFSGDGQSMIAYYHDILKDAAKANLLVNFHGSTLPRGWQRTYPNLMTMESIKGFEFTTFTQENQDAVAAHAVMSLFARNVFDPMDFTPVVFGDIPNIERKTNNSFELAESVLFLSGIQHFADTPEGMAQVPEYVTTFLADLPKVWDDVKFIEGHPNQYAVIARRSGNQWYIAGMNGSLQDIKITLDLAFTKTSEIEIIENGKGARDFNFRQGNAKNLIHITLPATGGFVARAFN